MQQSAEYFGKITIKIAATFSRFFFASVLDDGRLGVKTFGIL